MSISTVNVVFLYSPLIISGTLNMVFVKSNTLNSLKTPLDYGYTLPNKKRLFGANKTWKGLFGMCLFTSISMWLFGHFAFYVDTMREYNFFEYNKLPLNIVWLYWGFLIGLSYALFELPNSLIKRQLDIEPGTNVSGVKGFFFTIVDQIDSLIGVVLVFSFMFPLTFLGAVELLAVGTVLHLIVNIFLYMFGLKKQWR